VLIIPYFIQHRGCPHRCLFCNQNAIAGTETSAHAKPEDDLRECIDRWLGRSRKQEHTQVAFFGGSFTCLEEILQRRLLEGVQPYIRAGSVDSIRLSTRPDCVSKDICEFLFSYGVHSVELGVQSMDDTVLQRAHRGHDSEDSLKAIKLLKLNKFEVGVQLMPGLPGETTISFLKGVRALGSLQPDFARLYPTLVIKHTDLAELYETTSWKPLTMNKAVTLCRKAQDLFSEQGIEVIRTGLQPSVELENQVIAGPYHPAFGELVLGRRWYLRARKLLCEAGPGRSLTMTISDRDYSAFVGPGKQNINRLRTLPFGGNLFIETDTSLERGTFHHAIS
jgi:histone acetyltransferase (RNA polymerase elongator complex component)